MPNLQSTFLDSSTAKIQYSNSLFSLFSRFYDNISYDNFVNDLENKDTILILHNGEELSTSNIVGFSTLAEYDLKIFDREVTIFFNGDTIINPQYWGTTIMPRAWANLFFNKKASAPSKAFYWFLISSGHRTFRLLPNFFINYYPKVEGARTSTKVTSEENFRLKNILEIIAKDRFGESFNPKTGLISPKNPTPLKAQITIPNSKKSQNPAIKFFLSANKEHTSGIELACIAEIAESNLTKSGLKLLSK